MSNDYEKAYEAGRRGEIYTGGGIIGFLVAGVFGAIVRLSFAGLALIARFLPVLVWTGMGLFIGAVYGAGPARHAIGAYAVVGAVIGLGVWFVTRLLKKR